MSHNVSYLRLQGEFFYINTTGKLMEEALIEIHCTEMIFILNVWLLPNIMLWIKSN